MKIQILKLMWSSLHPEHVSTTQNKVSGQTGEKKPYNRKEAPRLNLNHSQLLRLELRWTHIHTWTSSWTACGDRTGWSWGALGEPVQPESPSSLHARPSWPELRPDVKRKSPRGHGPERTRRRRGARARLPVVWFRFVLPAVIRLFKGNF